MSQGDTRNSDSQLSLMFRALLLTDLVDSTLLVNRLGDVRSAELFQRVDEIARDRLSECSAVEIDRTDGHFFVFERPIDAVRCALAYHEGLAQLSREIGEEVCARAGIHFAEVVLRPNPPEARDRGARPFELEGLALPVTARIMSLALGGQTLLSRAAFDLARRAAVGDAGVPSDLRWLAHGPYLFKGSDEPIQICEVGLAGQAPLKAPPDSDKVRRAIAAGDEITLGWRPANGQKIPTRPNWVLRDRLGEGGFGEVWLAEHLKTHEKRVFKFCLQADRLRGLKREVTIFRLLKESLGERNDIARIFDWNFESAPYFVESEYTHGGNLLEWSEEQGGISEVPLATRLELVAQVAEALAAAHSIGILHKDIKPSNILITRDQAGNPMARLTDFGIGLILDQHQPALQGMTTAMGESSVLGAETSRTGTRLYMAPELIEGKTPTTLCDIYSLGVLLYQSVSGDFRRALASGWESDISDEFLLQDISECVDGHPERRIQSAVDLAQRLRTLDLRRMEKAARIEAEIKMQEEAERQRKARRLAEQQLQKARIRQRQLRALSTLGACFTAVVIGLAIYAFAKKTEAESNYRRVLKAEEEVKHEKANVSREQENNARTKVDLERERLEVKNALTSATTAESEAKRQGRLARIAEARAKSHLAFGEDLVSVILSDLYPKLQPIGKTEILDAVTTPALQFYQVAPEDELSTESRRMRATALNKLGELFRTRGELDKAREAFTSSTRILDGITSSAIGEGRWALDRTMAQVGLASVYELLDGKQDEARQLYETAVATSQRLVRSFSSDGNSRDLFDSSQTLALSLMGHGKLITRSGQPRMGLTDLNRARDILQQSVDNVSSFPIVLHNLAQCTLRIGAIWEDLHEFTSASEQYKWVIEHLEPQRAIDGNNMMVIDDLAQGYGFLANVKERQADQEKSPAEEMRLYQDIREEYNQVRDLREQLVQWDPDNTVWKRALAITLARVGYVLEHDDNFDQARVVHERSFSIRDQLFKSCQTNMEWAADWAAGHDNLGRVFAGLKLYPEAREHFMKARRAKEALCKSNPSRIQYKLALASSCCSLGDAYAKLNDSANASESYGRALETLKQIPESWRDDMWQRLFKAAHGEKSGSLNNDTSKGSSSERHGRRPTAGAK